jgi:transposase
VIPPPAITLSAQCGTGTKENGRRYDRSGLRDESDVMDEEWARVGPLIPSAKPGGNRRAGGLREVLNGLMYILGTGCQWRALPKDIAPRSTVRYCLDRWTWDGTLERNRLACPTRDAARAGLACGQPCRRGDRQPER